MSNFAGRGRARKPTVRNNFYFFMEDFKRQQESTGMRFNNMQEVSQKASPAWQAMSPEKKEVYNRKAKEWKEQNRGNDKKYTSTGVSVADIEREENELKNAKIQEEAYINDTVEDAVKNDSLGEMLFYVINTNYYCKTIDGRYITCEVAAASFNLNVGVDTVYHKLVHCTLPMGYAYEASQQSERMGLDVPPLKNATDDLVLIYTDLIGFLSNCSNNNDSAIINRAHLLPFYAMPDDIGPITNFLDQLCNSAGETNIFKVYSLPKLFKKLRNSVSRVKNDVGFPTVPLALCQLEKDIFKFSHDLCCDTHKIAVQYYECSLSRVKRMIFVICDHCCKFLDISLIAGHHIPIDADPMGVQSRVSSERSMCSVKQEKFDDYEQCTSSSGWTVVKSPQKVLMPSSLSKQKIRKPFGAQAKTPTKNRYGADISDEE